LHWGLDNWIYVANGRCDGDVRRPDAPAETAMSIRGRDFRFHPISGECQAILGQSQFGQAHDAWGNRFLSWNIIPIRHVLLEDADVRGYPAAAAEAAVNIAEPNDTGRVYPISAPPRQFNTEPAHYYNATCGVTIFTGDALGAAYGGNAFVCESLTNLVNRRVLQASGPTFVSRRGSNENDREFLASTDGWFHPVNLATGPDGALYVVDFYREFVEHPLYVADETQRATVNWRTGAEHGRIWRIRRADRSTLRAERRPRLSDAASEELVALLEHPVAWWRNTAQRLLVERQDQTVVPRLRIMLVESPSPLARLHAMYVLDGLEGNNGGDRTLDDPSLRRALHDAEANVRRHAVRLAAGRMNSKDELIEMSGDPDAGVRFQLALAIGGFTDPQSSRALSKLLEQDGTPLMQLAVLCGSGRNPWPLMRELLNSEDDRRQHADFLERLSELCALQGSQQDLAECLDWIAADSSQSRSTGGLAMLAGLSRGLFAKGGSLCDPKLPEQLASKHTIESLAQIVQSAPAIALDGGQSEENRSRATVIAANGEAIAVEKLARELIQPNQPQPVQTAAVWAAAQANSAGAWRTFFDQWTSHSTSTRRAVLEEALRSTAGLEALVSALEAGILAAQELPASSKDALGTLRDEPLRQRAQPILAAAAPANRAEVVARYAKAASGRGHTARGARVFQQHCQTCHEMQGVGHKLGPDLASIASRQSDLLIADILDPSRQVLPDYLNYIVVTTDGRVLSGLIAGETTESLTLRREEGRQETILRRDIEELRSTGKSIMPDGLEKLITPEQLADLLEFMRQPEVAQLEN
jgi:putative heme-binding domain-containing protein